MLLLLQIAVKVFTHVLNFLLNGPHKTAWRIFDILQIEILTTFFVLVT